MSKFQNKLKPLEWLFLLSTAWITARAFHFIWRSLDWPAHLSLDASLMRFHAWSLLHGRWPWRDIETINLPVTHYLNLFGLLVFGEDSFGFRLFDIFWVFLIATLVFLYLRRISLWAAGLGFALAICLPLTATPLGALQRETMMLPFWILIAWGTEKLCEEKPARHIFLGLGVCTGIIGWIKPSALPIAVFSLLLVASRHRFRKQNLMSLLPTVLLYGGLGVFGITFLICLPLLLEGIFDDFLFRWWEYTISWSRLQQTSAISALAANLFTFAPQHWALPLNQPVQTANDIGHLTLFHILILLSWIALTCTGNVKKGAGLITIVLAGFVNYLAQRKGFQYHLYPLWLGLNMMLAVLIAKCMELYEQSDGRKRYAFLAIFVLTLATILTRQASSFKIYAGTGLYASGDVEKLDSRVIAFIGSLTEKFNERPLGIQTFEINSIALGAVLRYDLRFSSRFPMDHLFWQNSEHREAARKQLLTELRAQTPGIIAYNEKSEAEKDRINGFQELKIYIDSNYHLESRLEEITGEKYRIYIRKDLK